MKSISQPLTFAGFALALALLVGSDWLSLRDSTRAQEAARWVAHTQEVRFELSELLAHLQDIETGTRGYLLTGLAEYLEPYDAGLKAVAGQLQLLRQLTRTVPEPQRHLDTLAQLIERRLVFASRVVQTRRDAGFTAAQALVAGGEGKAIMDAARAAIAQMAAVEVRLLAARVAETERESTRARQMTLLCSGLSVGLFVAVFALMLHENRLRQRASLALRDSEENLAVTLDSIGDAVLATDAAGRITRLNPIAEQLTGWRHAEALGRPVAEVFHILNEGTRQPAVIPVEKVLATGEIHGLANHTLLLAHDGTEYPIADSAAPIRSREGRILGVVLVFRDVTHEKQMERAVHQSEVLRRAVINSMMASIAVVDGRGTIITINEGWERFARENSADPALPTVGVGANYLEVCERAAQSMGAEAQDVLNGIRGVLAGSQATFKHEYACHSPTERRWFNMQVTPLARAEGGAVIAQINITERKRAEERIIQLNNTLEQRVRERTAELQLERAKLAAAFENMELGVVIANADGNDIVMNIAAERMHGFASRADLHTRLGDYASDWELSDAAGRALPFAEWPLARAVRGDHFRDWEVHLRNFKSGHEWDCSYTSAPVRNDKGAVSLLVLTLVDITERKRAEDGIRTLNAELEERVRLRTTELSESEERVRLAAEAAGVAVWDWEVKSGVITWDHRMFTIYGLPPTPDGKASYQDWCATVLPADLTKQEAQLQRTVETGGRSQREFRIVRKTDQALRIIQATETAVPGPDGRTARVVGVNIDITERRHAEERLHHANAGLAQASRHKDDFLANMSHELRTPLNAILGLSEALLEQVSGSLTPRQVKSVTTISTSGQHLLGLINDILDLSKIEAGKLELNRDTVNLRDFCESCLVFVRTQAMQKHIAVAFEPDEQVTNLSADPKRLKQILVNLLTNAVKFTPDGGRIGLTVTAPADGDTVRFTVWDTGIGIAPEDQTKLFHAFTQIDSGLNRSQEGTGLGLVLVAKLAELHGGSVALESAPGQGSRFTVSLPQIAGRPGAACLTAKSAAVRPVYRRALLRLA